MSRLLLETRVYRQMLRLAELLERSMPDGWKSTDFPFASTGAINRKALLETQDLQNEWISKCNPR